MTGAHRSGLQLLWRVVMAGLLQIALHSRAAATGAAAATAAGGAPAPTDEAAVMRLLRRALHDTDPSWLKDVPGWSPSDSTPHCLWKNVQCNSDFRVVAISVQKAIVQIDGETVVHGGGSPPHGGGSVPLMPLSAKLPLLPELAQLEWLEKLVISHEEAALRGLPSEWFQPGVFLWLSELMVVAGHLTEPLPDIFPDTLPSLMFMRMIVSSMHTTLPASWGQPGVLPALSRLILEVPFYGGLPSTWAAGFHQLQYMSIICRTDDAMVHSQASNSTAAWLMGKGALVPLPAPRQVWGAAKVATPQMPPLPAEWALGFPQVEELVLEACTSGSTIPSTWLGPSFPALRKMRLNYMNLTGTLPAQFFENHLGMEVFMLKGNQFSGTLPDAWANSQIEKLNLASNNLTGNAFPPAWLALGTFLHLHDLDVADNPGLGGTLPAGPIWPTLFVMDLGGTGFTGTIPYSWCQAPFHLSIFHIWLRGTAVDTRLPACAVQDLPQLAVHQNLYQASYRGHLSSTGIALLLLLAMVATASAVAGMALFRRRRSSQCLLQQQQHQQQVGEDQNFPPGIMAEERNASGRSFSVPSSRDLNRRARLVALLNTHVGGQHGQLDTLRMLPLEALPETLTHHVDASAPRGATVGAGLQAGASRRRQRFINAADAEMQRKHSGGEAAPLLATGHVSVQIEMSCMNSGAEPPGSSNGADDGARQWGLDTQSLLVSPGDLTFSTSLDGNMVDLGAGSHGVVFLAKLQGQEVAVKVYEMLPGMESEALWKEAQLLSTCSHPHIVPLLGVALKGPLLMLAMEWMRGGSLRIALETLDTRTRLAWRQCGRQVATDVADALAYMHGTLHIMHSDLKSSNVLLSSDLRGHIADLGLAQLVGSAGRTAVGGTRKYAAPEQLMGHKCTLAADIYSLGIVLVELTTQEMGGSRGEWRLPSAPHECPEEVVSLIGDCIQADPQRRPSAEQVSRRLHAT